MITHEYAKFLNEHLIHLRYYYFFSESDDIYQNNNVKIYRNHCILEKLVQKKRPGLIPAVILTSTQYHWEFLECSGEEIKQWFDFFFIYWKSRWKRDAIGVNTCVDSLHNLRESMATQMLAVFRARRRFSENIRVRDNFSYFGQTV